MMKVDEFVRQMRLAASVKSIYIKGCFGAPMNDSNKKRYTQNNEYNKRPARTAKIMACAPDVFGSDCCGVIKAVLWDWNSRVDKQYGGAVYKSNGVPDVGADGMIKACKDATTDFSKIEPGMLVWMSGHVGIYVGDGQVVESTPSFNDGCQFTNLGNTGHKTGNWRTWKKCGHLPWVDYGTQAQAPAPAPSEKWYTVSKGDNLTKIARRNGMTVSQLIKLNPQIKNPNIIIVGQKIRIK